jgi:hypothetical protein
MEILLLCCVAYACAREQAPDVGTSLAAGLADELRLNVGQPDMVRPAIGTHLNRVAAPVIRAIYQEIANPGGAHFSKGDLHRTCEIGHTS